MYCGTIYIGTSDPSRRRRSPNAPGIGSEDDLGVFPLVAAHHGEPVPISYELFPPEDIGSCFGV